MLGALLQASWKMVGVFLEYLKTSGTTLRQTIQGRMNGWDKSLWAIRRVIETHDHWPYTHWKVDVFSPPLKPGRCQSRWKHSAVWASLDLDWLCRIVMCPLAVWSVNPLFLCSFMKWRNIFSHLLSIFLHKITHLSIRWQDANDNIDTETRCLV